MTAVRYFARHRRSRRPQRCSQQNAYLGTLARDRGTRESRPGVRVAAVSELIRAPRAAMRRPVIATGVEPSAEYALFRSDRVGNPERPCGEKTSARSSCRAGRRRPVGRTRLGPQAGGSSSSDRTQRRLVALVIRCYCVVSGPGESCAVPRQLSSRDRAINLIHGKTERLPQSLLRAKRKLPAAQPAIQVGGGPDASRQIDNDPRDIHHSRCGRHGAAGVPARFVGGVAYEESLHMPWG